MTARIGIIALWTAAVFIVGLVARRWVYRSFYRDLTADRASVLRRLRADELAGAFAYCCLLLWIMGDAMLALAFSLVVRTVTIGR